METLEIVKSLGFTSIYDIIDVEAVLYLHEEVKLSVSLRVFNFIMRKYDQVVILRSDLDVPHIKMILKNRGFLFTDFDELMKHLTLRLNKILAQHLLGNGDMVFLTHSTLGWINRETGLVFCADKIYTKDGVINSVYMGDKKIQPKGDLPVYLGMLKTCVCGNIPLEAVCAMAAAATVLSFANMCWDCKFDNPINHIVETSSTGKTTAVLLFVSFGAAPEAIGSWLLTYLGTNNALLKQLEGNMGYPVGIDELSSSGRTACTQLTYSIGNGVGRSRCTAGGTKVSEAGEFHTVILSSGESGLIKKCAKTDGIAARVFEYEGVRWTRSGSESRQIKSVIRDNYGWVTPLIAVELMKNSDKWEKVLNKWKEEITQRMENEKRASVIGDRVVNVVALYMTGCEILNEVLGIGLNTSKVYEFFYLHIIIAKTSDAGLGLRAYDAVIRHYRRYKKERYADGAIHMSSLSAMIEEDDFNTETGMEGFVLNASRSHKSKDGRIFGMYIVFLSGVLEEILDNNGFSDAKVAIRSMNREGLMKTKDKARDYIEVSIDGVKEKVFAVWVQDTSYFDTPTEDDYDAEADELEN